MTTQPHAIPSKQDELYDIAAVHADDFREFAAGHEFKPDCYKHDGIAKFHVTASCGCDALMCAPCRRRQDERVTRNAARGTFLICQKCGEKVDPHAVKVVPL